MLNRLIVQSRLSMAIAAAFAAEGLNVEGLNVDQTMEGFTVKLSLTSPEKKQLAVEHEKSMARAFGLPEQLLGKTLQVNRKRLKVSGFNPGAPKNAVNLVCVSTGKQYKCSAAYALACPVIA